MLLSSAIRDSVDRVKTQRREARVRTGRAEAAFGGRGLGAGGELWTTLHVGGDVGDIGGRPVDRDGDGLAGCGDVLQRLRGLVGRERDDIVV